MTHTEEDFIALQAQCAAMRLALESANDVSRSAYQVAARGGLKTNWPGLTTRLGEPLKVQLAALNAASSAGSDLLARLLELEAREKEIMAKWNAGTEHCMSVSADYALLLDFVNRLRSNAGDGGTGFWTGPQTFTREVPPSSRHGSDLLAFAKAAHTFILAIDALPARMTFDEANRCKDLQDAALALAEKAGLSK